jgi:hypothetical protein
MAKEQKRVSDLQEIAALENKMVDEDANDATPRPNARQNPRPLRRSYAVASLYADEEETVEETDGNREEPESVTEPPTDQEEPPKKKAKKAPKPKARTEIMVARKAAAMEVDSEVEVVEDLVPVDDRDDKVRKASATSKSKFVPFVLTLVPVTMLTLDETTLFYYNLYSDTGAKNPTTAVEEWQTGVKPVYAPRSKTSSRAPSKPGSRANYAASSSTGTAPSLTAASTVSRSSSRSVLTKNVVIHQARGKAMEERSFVAFGGVSDDDEANGEERLVAAASPFKAKVRLTSSVRRLTFGSYQ